MPRISAATVAEHVAAQEAAVIGAARDLFNARGVQNVTLADIAQQVGLGRTALYRYFPTKAHILQRWFDLAMAPLVEASRVAAEGPGSAEDRLAAWLRAQVDFLVSEEHTALVSATASGDDLPEDVRTEIGARHRELYATLAPLLAGADPTTARARTLLIAGAVRSAADLIRSGTPRSLVESELLRTALAAADYPATAR